VIKAQIVQLNTVATVRQLVRAMPVNHHII
jgi:hypothetical protein